MAKRRRRGHRRAVAHRRRNPSRRYFRRRHRRRNPSGRGVMGIVKSTIRTAVPSLAGGAVMGLVDSQFLSGLSTPFRIGGKIALAALAGHFLRSRPATAYAVMGSMLGTAGYDLGVRLGGGIVTKNPQQTKATMTALLTEDPAAMSAVYPGLGPALGQSPAGMGTDPLPEPDPSTINLG